MFCRRNLTASLSQHADSRMQAASHVDAAGELWVATEQLPRFRAVFPESRAAAGARGLALRNRKRLARCARLSVTPGMLGLLLQSVCRELALPHRCGSALLALEVEGFARPLIPVSQAAVVATKRHRQSGVSAGFCSGSIDIRSTTQRKSASFTGGFHRIPVRASAAAVPMIIL